MVACAFTGCDAGFGAGAGDIFSTTVSSTLGATAAATASIMASDDPSDTLSPTFTNTDSIVPATTAGTSIAALSVSSVTSESSTSTLSPAEIYTSMTSTSSKSPRSGTTSVCLPADFGGASSSEANTVVSPVIGAAIAAVISMVSPTSIVKVPITSPVDTVSPTLTASDPTTPFSGDGISIDALSVSTVIKPSSRSTVSPLLTSTSMTSTFSKSPRSGITMSIVLTILSFPDPLQRHRIGTIRVDAVFIDRLRDSLVIEHTIIGQCFER